MSRAIFVYGSLRTGEFNHHLVEPFVSAVAPAAIRGMGLYPVTPHYPGMVSREGGEVTGELVTIKPQRWLDALVALDHLEDYYGPGDPANHYDRVLLPVQTPGGTRLAFTYLWVRGIDGLQEIPGGDWCRYRR